jgi:hypothetical protein
MDVGHTFRAFVHLTESAAPSDVVSCVAQSRHCTRLAADCHSVICHSANPIRWPPRASSFRSCLSELLAEMANVSFETGVRGKSEDREISLVPPSP